MSTFCYHGRDSKGVKLFVGMLHADNWEQAAERATAGHSVKLSTFGGNWVNNEGKEVYLYLSVMPDQTKRGQALIDQARKERDAERKAEQEREEALQDELDNAINECGGVESALARLRAKES